MDVSSGHGLAGCSGRQALGWARSEMLMESVGEITRASTIAGKKKKTTTTTTLQYFQLKLQLFPPKKKKKFKNYFSIVFLSINF